MPSGGSYVLKKEEKTKKNSVNNQLQQSAKVTQDHHLSLYGCYLDIMLTTVVGERHNGGEVALAVLSDDPEAGEGALFAGDVEGRVTTVISQPWVTASFKESFYQVWLLCDHC